MAKLVNIDSGAAGWDKSIEANFEALNQDSGWITPTIIAPAMAPVGNSPVEMRLYKGIVLMDGGVVLSEDINFGGDGNPTNAGIKIISFPTQFAPAGGWIWCEAVESFAQETARISIQPDGIYLHKSLLKTASLDFGSVPAYIAKVSN
ncbi:hypothetical protein [Lactiplantibacillus pingfangensis]|uniref:hypothetical protein n=1 Tax=Lactiplantibacillus TaxID=2767842 RepID=UPI0010F679A4|nr:hypothetical protein [Lactiplantibacillus pingfangensis]